MKTATEAFIFAETLCSGSTLDNYATCILNNMRFMPYTKDNTVSLAGSQNGIVSNVDLPALAGKTYIDLKPIAISDVKVRMLQKNDSGQVRFRCLDVFSQPMLPLTDLQDLGLEHLTVKHADGVTSFNITNAIDFDTEGSIGACTDSYTYYAGVPIKCIDDTGLTPSEIQDYLMYNIRSHIIFASNLYNSIDTELSNIRVILANNGDYNKLLTKQRYITDNLVVLNEVLDIVTGLLTFYSPTQIYYKQNFSDTLAGFYDLSSTINDYLSPISQYVTTSTDWSTFQYYNELLGIVANIDILNSNISYLRGFYLLSHCIAFAKLFQSTYVDNKESDILASLRNKYDVENFNLVNKLTTKIQSYSVGVIKLDLAEEFAEYDSLRSFYRIFMSQNSLNIYNLISNPISFFNFSSNPTLDELNTFWQSKGNTLMTEVSSLYTILAAKELSTATITELDLGASFKDQGKYYFANVAYAVGFGTLSNIHQLQIDNNIYDTTAITSSNGSVVDQISQSGCTKYRFKQKLFTGAEINNSNTQDVEMYIYPGTADQPFCPTINKYHNPAVCNYSGLFTKLTENADGSVDSSLFLYKNYNPIANTLQELIKLGSSDINAIDLSLPTLDQNSTEAFIKRQIVALSNSSSMIKDATITTKDLKYYVRANLIGSIAPVEASSPISHQGLQVNNAINYPYLAIIEFVNMPLGQNFKAPAVRALMTAVDTPVKG